MLVGAISLVLAFSMIVLGVKFAFGAFSGGYELYGEFTAAGQGLQHDSDVKIRGVDIGKVSSIKLRDGKALVKLHIDEGQRVPVTARAVIRPKTLFGEKFVDIEPGEDEGRGPYLAHGARIENTLGGIELERVLTEAYPILKAIDPAELGVVIGTLADAGKGLGPTINRSIVNGQKLAAITARHDADARQFFADFANLSEELAKRADDVVQGATDLNSALPTLNAHGDDLNQLLTQTARLSGDVADLLDANRSFLRKSVTEGGKGLQVLYDHRTEVIPLVIGLRQYLETLTSVIRIPVGDGTYMAAVKGITGGDVCAPDCPGNGQPAAPGDTTTTTTPAAPLPGLPDLGGLFELPGSAPPPTGADALLGLANGLVGK
jgi:phospholipid/cholesterol/gamma-HCH transport system substrate-binding protein